MTSITDHITAPRTHGVYGRTINFTRQYLKPSKIDRIEILAILITVQFTTAILGKYTTSLLLDHSDISNSQISNKGFLIHATLAIILSIGYLKRHVERIKHPFIKKEIQYIIESSKKNKQSMLIFHTTCDPDGAFMNHHKLALYEKLAEKYSLEILEGFSKSEIQAAMEVNHKKYDRIDFHAHAGPQSIELAADAYLVKNSKRTLNWLNSHIQDGGIICLDGCSAGKGEENIARDISRACPKATIYAAKDTISGIVGVEYEDDAIPVFNNGMSCKGKDITRIYQNGISIT